jgi:hypothetical protein
MASNRGQILPRNYGFLVRVFIGPLVKVTS